MTAMDTTIHPGMAPHDGAYRDPSDEPLPLWDLP